MYSLRLRKVTEEFSGLPWSWIIPVGIYCILTVFIPILVVFLVNSIVVRIVLITVVIISVIYCRKNMRSPTVLAAHFIQLGYKYRVHKGEHIIPKHKVPLQFLKRIIPLEKAHPNGLIEFTNNRYGIMYRLFVPRRTGAELDLFIELITKNIINRIHDGQILKVFEMQRYTTDAPIKNQVVEAMNDETKTLEQIAHLNSIYNQLTDEVEIPTKPYVYAFVVLGRYDDIKEAENERDNLTPSLEDGFKLAGVGYDLLIVPDAIGREYRRCIY